MPGKPGTPSRPYLLICVTTIHPCPNGVVIVHVRAHAFLDVPQVPAGNHDPCFSTMHNQAYIYRLADIAFNWESMHITSACRNWLD
jgi:hypothetical protein